MYPKCNLHFIYIIVDVPVPCFIKQQCSSCQVSGQMVAVAGAGEISVVTTEGKLSYIK